MDSIELVKVIKACRQAGVSKLKLGELEIEFKTGDAVETLRPTGDAGKPPTDQELKEAEHDALVSELKADLDDDLATMQIEDPARFEELLVQREFELGEAAQY